MTTPTRFTAEDYDKASDECLHRSLYFNMLRQAAEQARTLEQIRQWAQSETPDHILGSSDSRWMRAVRATKVYVLKLLDGETAR